MIAGVLLSAFVLGGLGGTAAAQDNFEPADFNVTSELLTLGVDVNALPELSGWLSVMTPRLAPQL